MIEIIILIFLTREIGRMALSKGLKPLTWKIYNVLGWLTFEFIGLLFGLMIFGKDNLISINLIGIAFAITSYFLIKGQLNKLPDKEAE
ncbi:MAG: hypothetical protein ABI288_10230 [Ginsengibacter sp.]